MPEIRRAVNTDRDAIWEIFQEVVSAGDTYPIDPKISREDAFAYWFQTNAHAYVAEHDRQIVGIYTLHPNQSGGGAHVANAAFMVAKSARGAGIGRAMGEHCLSEALTEFVGARGITRSTSSDIRLNPRSTLLRSVPPLRST